MSTETLIIFLLLMFSFSIFMALIFIHHFCKMSELQYKKSKKDYVKRYKIWIEGCELLEKIDAIKASLVVHKNR